mgnify:CR=1 FL=1
MALTIYTAKGQSVVLPESLSIDENELSATLPGVEIPGRHGIVDDPDLQRIEPRTFRISGSFEGMTRTDANAISDMLRLHLLGNPVFWLKTHEDATRMIRVHCERVTDDPHRGRFRGRLVSITASLIANDPFWYGIDPVVTSRSFSFGSVQNPLEYDFVLIQNESNVAVKPLIWVCDGATEFEIENLTTEETLSFNGGSIPVNQVLVADSSTHRVGLLSSNGLDRFPDDYMQEMFPVLHPIYGTKNKLCEGNNDFLFDSCALVPG